MSIGSSWSSFVISVRAPKRLRIFYFLKIQKFWEEVTLNFFPGATRSDCWPWSDHFWLKDESIVINTTPAIADWKQLQISACHETIHLWSYLPPAEPCWKHQLPFELVTLDPDSAWMGGNLGNPGAGVNDLEINACCLEMSVKLTVTVPSLNSCVSIRWGAIKTRGS